MAVLVGEGGPEDRDSIRLATRTNRWIPNERRPERPPQALRAAVELWAHMRPEAILRSITAVYNCAGLVFASRRTFIDPHHIPMILNEDGYHQLSDLSKVEVGDLVIYRAGTDDSISHIGIVIGRKPRVETATWEITVMSKWGADGEYIHPIEHVPSVYGQPVELWTDRRTTDDL